LFVKAADDGSKKIVSIPVIFDAEKDHGNEEKILYLSIRYRFEYRYIWPSSARFLVKAAINRAMTRSHGVREDGMLLLTPTLFMIVHPLVRIHSSNHHSLK
jgi:hypothetical protein